MPWIRMPDGTVAHVRVASTPRKKCVACGRLTSDLECDGTATPEAMKRRRNKTNTTCNARLCAGCAVRVGDQDFCPRCAGERNLGVREVTAGETATKEETDMSYQHIVIAGNLGKDPEMRYTQSGSGVCTMSVAVSERMKDGDNWKDHTEWFRVVCFGKTAENANQYLAKGRKVLVEGVIRQRTYQKNDGTTGYSTELICNRLVFLSPKNEGSGPAPSTSRPTSRPAQGQQQRQASPPPASTTDAAPPPDEPFFDDDLPF